MTHTQCCDQVVPSSWLHRDPQRRPAHQEGTAEELKTLIERDHGQPPTLEAVFMTYTGRSLDDDVEEESSDDD